MKTLQHTATNCNTLPNAAARCNTLQNAATRCNTLHYAATRCITPQHDDFAFDAIEDDVLLCVGVCCSVL